MARAAARIITERELKLGAWPEFVVPDLGRAVKGARVAPGTTTVQLDADYFDTADLRLLRRGVTLRFRRGEPGGDVWTAKLPSDAAVLGLARREISLPGEPGAVPQQMRDLTRGWAFGAALKRVATIRTTRRTIRLVDDADRPLAVIDDDDVRGLLGRRVAARFRELEVELAAEAPSKTLRALAKALETAGALPAAQVPKLVRTLGPAADEPWDLAPLDLGTRPNVGQVIRGRVIAALTTVVDLHAAIVLDDDPSAVSRTLAAIDALDMDLRLFEPVFETATDGQHAAPDELKRALARLRDDDGCIRRVRAAAGRGEADADPGPVLAALEQARADSHAEFMTLLRSARHRAWLARFRALATDGPPTGAKAKRRAATALPAMTRPRIRELRDRIVGLGESEEVPSFEDLDEPVRLLRHLVALTAPYADKASGRADDDAQRLVTLVDEVRQARATTARLRALAAASEPRTAWSAGVFAGMQIDRVAGAADALGPALLGLRRKSRWAALT